MSEWVNVSHWAWPQWVEIALMALGTVMAISCHGQPRDPWNGPASFTASCILLFVLAAGGFFR